MKRIVFVIFLFTACGGSLTDDQRKRLHEGMKKNEIHKVSDVQITEAAFALGRSMSQLTGARKDSLLKSNSVVWKELREDDASLAPIEKQIVEAYEEAGDNSNDNIQKVGKDSLLYTRPVLAERPDGSRKFKYAVGIRMSRKQVVISITH